MEFLSSLQKKALGPVVTKKSFFWITRGHLGSKVKHFQKFTSYIAKETPHWEQVVAGVMSGDSSPNRAIPGQNPCKPTFRNNCDFKVRISNDYHRVSIKRFNVMFRCKVIIREFIRFQICGGECGLHVSSKI